MHPISRMVVPRLGAALLLSAVLAPCASSQTVPRSTHTHAAGAARLGKVEFKADCNAAPPRPRQPLDSCAAHDGIN
jgi:hypothetical protein